MRADKSVAIRAGGFAACLLLLCSLIVEAAEKPALPDGYKLLYEQNFESTNALAGFVVPDPAAWKLSKNATNAALELATQNKYEPPFRSPVNIALIADKIFGDFILEADMFSTGKDVPQLDMCVFYAFKNPTNFYYTHIAASADDNHHNTMIVHDAPRARFTKDRTQGVKWANGQWHHIRLERKIADGSIKVYFDDMTKTVITGEDKTFDKGLIGFGSFDDTGIVDNIKIWGPAVETTKTDFFKSLTEKKN